MSDQPEPHPAEQFREQEDSDSSMRDASPPRSQQSTYTERHTGGGSLGGARESPNPIVPGTSSSTQPNPVQPGLSQATKPLQAPTTSQAPAQPQVPTVPQPSHSAQFFALPNIRPPAQVPIGNEGQARRAEAMRRFTDAYPDQRYSRILTSTEGLLCGLHAIQRMMRDVPGLPEPTIHELFALADVQAMHDVDRIFGHARAVDMSALRAVNNMNMFSVDQLDNVVRVYGLRNDMDLRLGYVLLENGQVNMVGRLDNDIDSPNQHMIWVELDARGLGHFSAIASRTYRPTDDDAISQYDKSRYLVILSFSAVLLLSQYDSDGLPQALRGTDARETDWNQTVKRRAAAQQLKETFKDIGLKSTDDNKKLKTQHTTTPDDKKFLRASHKIYELYDDPLTYSTSPAKLWNPERKPDWKPDYKEWLRKREEPRGPSSSRPSLSRSSLNQTFLHPRSLFDKVSLTARTLGDIALGSLGHKDENKSVRRDRALLATGSSIDALLRSGWLTDRGAAILSDLCKDADADADADEDGEEDDGEEDEDAANEEPITMGRNKKLTHTIRIRPAGFENDICRRFDEHLANFTATIPSGGDRRSSRFRPSSASASARAPSSQTPGTISTFPTPLPNVAIAHNQHGATPDGAISQTIPLSTPSDRPSARKPSITSAGNQCPSAGDKRPHPPSPEQSRGPTSLEIILDGMRPRVDDAREFIREQLADLIRGLRRAEWSDDELLALAAWKEWFPNDDPPSTGGS